MHRARTIPSTGAYWLLLLATAVYAGCNFCEPHRSCCNDIPPGAIPQPSGTYACQWVHAEMGRADQENFVIYQYEWSADGVTLTPYGHEHVGYIAKRFCQAAMPVVIEPSPEARVNEARKREVITCLANCGVQPNSEGVVLCRSEAEGLYGQEAPGIADAMLNSRRGGLGVGAGYGATESGTFSPAQGGTYGITQGSAMAPATGIGIGVQ